MSSAGFARRPSKTRIRLDCWVWAEAIGNDGYGRFWSTSEAGWQKMIRAHRYVLGLVHGGLDAIADREACHACNNPICVRGVLGANLHAYPSTRESNMTDRAWQRRHKFQFAAEFFRHSHLPNETAIPGLT